MQRIINAFLCTVVLVISCSSLADLEPSMSVDDWHSQGKYFEYGQHKIFYRDSGVELNSGSDIGKPVIVLLHGFPTSSWDWHKLWNQLDDNYRLITLDFLGFGFSDKPDSGYSIDGQADLVVQLLSYREVRQAHLLVHDYGTYVAQELVARQNSAAQLEHRFSIQSLVMLNGVVDPQSIQLRPIQKALKSPFGWIVSQFVSFNRFSRNISAVFGQQSQPSARNLQDFWYLITLNDGHRISHKLVHYYDESLLNADRWVGALSSTNVPVMLITGLADPVAGKPMVDKFEELMPNQEVHVLDGIGHYPHIEDESSVADYYLQFLDKHHPDEINIGT